MSEQETDRTPRIGTGYVWVDAPCPECGALIECLAVIRSVLTVPQDDPGTIRLRLKAKPVDHECRLGVQAALFLRDALGLHVSLPEPEDDQP